MKFCYIRSYDKVLPNHGDTMRGCVTKGSFLFVYFFRNYCSNNFGIYFREFNIDNHVILGPSNYLRRAVNENNIQDYVSSITSKPMPNNLPQWQIVLIPSAGTDNMVNFFVFLFVFVAPQTFTLNYFQSSDKYFMLVRMHHLILAEEKDLKMNDFLLATSLPTTSIPLDDLNQMHSLEPSEPFSNFVPTLVHIPQLYNELALIVCNKWNELLNSYGGSNNNLEVKNEHGLFDLAVVIFISVVTVVIEFIKDFATVKEDTFKYFMNLCRSQIERKKLSVKCVLNSTLVSLHPKNVIESIVNTTFWITVNWCILLPMMCYKEFMAIIRYMLDPRKYYKQ